MERYSTSSTVQQAIGQYKNTGKRIGFVPTMGALHKGHLALTKAAADNADITVVSVFVNPTQFNDANDYKKYPRDIEDDLQKLGETNVDIVFTPSEAEIYPDNYKIPDFNFGNLETLMEGKFRPGHFKGVAQVVSRLFDIVQPDVAVFGEKDFQQLAIIRQLVKDYNYPLEIIGAPIVREPDGLAMSSRNKRLNVSERESAAYINQVLDVSRQKAAYMSVDQLKEWVISTLNTISYLEVEYFEIADRKTLQSVGSWQENCAKIGCIAVYCGNIRLIDNIKYSF